MPDESTRQRARRTQIYAPHAPCEVCGNPRTHAHHDDYRRPRDVRWLCASHHKMHHLGVTEEMRQEAATLRLQGWTFAAIGQHLGISIATAYEWTRSYLRRS